MVTPAASSSRAKCKSPTHDACDTLLNCGEHILIFPLLHGDAFHPRFLQECNGLGTYVLSHMPKTPRVEPDLHRDLTLVLPRCLITCTPSPRPHHLHRECQQLPAIGRNKREGVEGKGIARGKRSHLRCPGVLGEKHARRSVLSRRWSLGTHYEDILCPGECDIHKVSFTL